MSNERGNCIGCGRELTHLDDDPNRTCGPTCKRCLAEQEHDFDADPDAKFSETGERIVEPVALQSAATNPIQDALKQIKALPQRQDGVNDQLRDLRVIANHFGLYDAADAIREMLAKR
ncbi:hypothetical protein [Pseudomonas amygdali]|uniref:Anti-sigma-28 factor FlgM C-terminal domain-containing protein n=2 Tax=Pseudomonas amygdali pv. lachrymans TaxID=53707 RepID=A0ABR5KTD2_PSEAV|nr:hypothetical protein [Pseudomonas amygdali]AXH59715.1 hypothetical protein PLA107_031325 [Pseudomonas amygdali pv. lachrymans str. M301315]KPC17137.1 Uncharacterized protein AC499_0339 [Pseudomonas amygdali pv. lachrymans]KPC18096.1 Uncharacterized protein AC499_1298 [Pseudomonas amygdali pv. lachrymans]RMT05942.1 hypothetical protein ALP54_03621 [Pseudomonas amygdali pv. lachrymans]